MCLVYVPMLFLYHLYIVVWVTVWGSSQHRGAFIYPTLSQVLGEVWDQLGHTLSHVG